MHYVSTRGKQQPVTISRAMRQGLAGDGGLFIPKIFPSFNLEDFSQNLSYPQFCEKLLAPFFVGDALAKKLNKICEQAFDFPVPLKSLDDHTYLLELFHGPTLSFKDFGARFLANCFSQLSDAQMTIMVATSGDTGSAVASAFYKKPQVKVIVLFPKDKISKRQQKQITCWGDNVHAYAVEGTFDDCQKIIKSAKNISTANSINIGRLLPQMGYYAFTSLKHFKDKGVEPNFVVPSGNMGNVTAACYAKKCGFPIGRIVIATNVNRVVPDFLEKGIFQAQKTIPTIANAMDVGNPSNFERLQSLFPVFSDFQRALSAFMVSDDEIKETIADLFNRTGEIVCPHTATACYVRNHCLTDDNDWIIAATADPCKFESVIEPIIKKELPVAPALKKMLDADEYYDVVTLDAFKSS